MKNIALTTAVMLLAATPAAGQESDAPSAEDEHPAYLKDRGPGIPTSMFGTYVRGGELLVYPFFEYYKDKDAEYSPEELGYGLDQDFRGEFEASEYLIFLGYGLSDAIALEVEAAYESAELEKSAEDPTAVPEEISESGLGDVQTQVNWDWAKETEHRPGFFSYGEVDFPLQKNRVIIGTQDWEFKVGTGVVRGFSWGTTTLRASVEYERAEQEFGIGELAVEYLKRLSSLWKVYAGVEGTQDEWELITEAQIHVSSRAFIKLNSSFGLTSKATDWAPEVGVMFRF